MSITQKKASCFLEGSYWKICYILVQWVWTVSHVMWCGFRSEIKCILQPCSPIQGQQTGTRQGSHQLLCNICLYFPFLVQFDGKVVSEIKASQDGLGSVYFQVFEYPKRCLLWIAATIYIQAENYTSIHGGEPSLTARNKFSCPKHFKSPVLQTSPSQNSPRTVQVGNQL